LGVKVDKPREVPGIYNNPTGSATGWNEMFGKQCERGFEHISLLVEVGLIGLPTTFYELGMQISGFILLPIALIHGFIRNLMGFSNIELDIYI
jgi:hypothetical protein